MNQYIFCPMKQCFSKSTLSLFVENVNEKYLYWIQIDNKDTSTNTITVEFVSQLSSALEFIENSKETCNALIIKSMKKDSFIVGANIKMLQTFMDNEESKLNEI